ncbi:hypothetical protein, partial [Pseudomonas helleri]|uniref:hypothetical protein n=1 Tax=Pseudomonas helleri TaxID=1608996 RepID=UPI002F35B224
QRLSLKEHHHNGDALLGTQVVVLGRHGNTLHEVLHLLLETALPLPLCTAHQEIHSLIGRYDRHYYCDHFAI